MSSTVRMGHAVQCLSFAFPGFILVIRPLGFAESANAMEAEGNGLSSTETMMCAALVQGETGTTTFVLPSHFGDFVLIPLMEQETSPMLHSSPDNSDIGYQNTASLPVAYCGTTIAAYCCRWNECFRKPP